MRLPYLQVADEVDPKAQALAGLLGIHRQRAKGMLQELWGSALSWGHESEVPNGIVEGPGALAIIVGWCEWEGDHVRLQQSLQICGFIESIPSGLRVRGLSRYAGAFAKRRNDRERLMSLRHRSDVVGTSRGKTETETYTEKKQKKKKGAAPVAAPPPPGWPELVEQLQAAYSSTVQQPYTFGARDGIALAKLRNEVKAPDDVILGVWRSALTSGQWPKVRDVPGLAQHWNVLLANASERPRVALLGVDRPRSA